MISPPLLEEFRSLIRADYSVDLSPSEASDISRDILAIFEVLHRVSSEQAASTDPDA